MEMDTEESEIKRNLSRWELFLKPIKGLRVRQQKKSYDKETLGDLENCLSGNVARKLEQMLVVNQHELELSQRDETKRKLDWDDQAQSSKKRKVEISEDDSQKRRSSAIDGMGDTYTEELHIVKSHVASDAKYDDDVKYDVGNKYDVDKKYDVDNKYDVGKKYVNLQKVVVCKKDDGDNQAMVDDNSHVPYTLEDQIETQRTLISSQSLPPNYQYTALSQTPKRGSQYKPTNIPDDRSTPLSKWKLEKFAHYVDFTSVKPLTINLTTDERVKNDSLYDDIRGIFGHQNLESCITRESQARMAIDMLILKVCQYLNIQVKTEEEIKFNFLPTGKLDYYFLSAEEPLGCLEAKSPNTLDKHAFGQAVMELLLVQKMGERSKWVVKKKNKKSSDLNLTASQNSSTRAFTKTPFFCILSDGIRYVLMQVRGNNLYLEHDGDGEDAVIKIRSFQNKKDFNDLITSICYLIEEAKKLSNPSGDQ